MSLPFPDISQLAQQPCAISFNLSHFLRSDCEQSLSVPLLFFTIYFLNSDSPYPIFSELGLWTKSVFCFVFCAQSTACVGLSADSQTREVQLSVLIIQFWEQDVWFYFRFHSTIGSEGFDVMKVGREYWPAGWCLQKGRPSAIAISLEGSVEKYKAFIITLFVSFRFSINRL